MRKKIAKIVIKVEKKENKKANQVFFFFILIDLGLIWFR